MASAASVSTLNSEDHHHIESPLEGDIQKPSEHRPFLEGVNVGGLTL